MWILRSFILLGLVLSGCGGAKEAFNALGDIQQLHADLTAKYKEEISVRINNEKHLSIGLINSTIKDLPVEQRKQKARDVAIYAIDRYKNAKKLETVTVGYIVHKSYMMANYTDASEQYRFEVKELKAAGSGAAI